MFWLAIWQVTSMLIHQEMLLASPFRVFQQLLLLLKEPYFYKSILLSLSHVLLGFLLGMLLGTITSFLSKKYKTFNTLFTPFTTTIKTIPVASFIILILIWIPSRKLSIAIAALMVYPIYYDNLRTGIDAISPKLKQMKTVYQLDNKTFYFSQLIPYFQSATTLAISLSFKSGIAAEVIGLPKNSIGEQLYNAKVYFDTPSLFAWTIVIILLSFFLQKALNKLFQTIIIKVEND